MTPKEWAQLAQSAYTTNPSIGPEDSAGRIVFVQSENGLILAIPGTNNEKCAMADIDVLIHDAGDCGAVHKGIWDAFDPVWPDVSELDVYALVGHSEGASGAIYLGARLCLMGKAPNIIWAFEPPHQSIDSKLADIFTKYGVELHITRHGNDIVPCLPWPLPDMDWQHAGPVFRFGQSHWSFPNIEDHMLVSIIADI